MEDDLRATNTNILFKYADDTNRLVPKISDVDINDEFNNVLAEHNRMIVNLRKTNEIVFHKPSARYSLPSLVTGIEQVVSAKWLGVTFSPVLCKILLKSILKIQDEDTEKKVS